MLHHSVAGPVGTLVVVNTGWWGIGAMLSSAASWLPFSSPPVYVYCSNTLYIDKEFPPNQFEWFFDQQPPNYHFKLVTGRHPILPINLELAPTLATRLQDCVNTYWKLRPEYQPTPRESTLAVHYRGTDKGGETPLTKMASLFEQIDQNMADHHLQRLLLCTDDQDVLDAVIAQYPQCEYFPDHLRTTGKRGLHHTLGSYRQASEAFTELMAMGACTRLLCSRGCMADTAIILASNRELSWQYHN